MEIKFFSNKKVLVIFLTGFFLLVACQKPSGQSGRVDPNNSPDTINPLVTVLSPLENDIAGGSITFKVLATDNVGVDKVEFYVDNQIISTSKIASANVFSFTWNSGSLSDGAHTFKTIAYDYLNNQTPVSVIFQVNQSFFISSPKEDEVVNGQKVTVEIYKKTGYRVTQVDLLNASDNSSTGRQALNIPNGPYEIDLNGLTYGNYKLKAAGKDALNQDVFFEVKIAVAAPDTGTLTSIENFGDNPGNLKMWYYQPSGISTAKPLIVALHGCSQNASGYAKDTGWDTLADSKQFYVLYPEQQAENNGQNCFTWYSDDYQKRGVRETQSIASMINYMTSHFTISDVYITGFSAGGGMTAVMLATYPDYFKGGAILSGIAFQIATNVSEAGYTMKGLIDKTPAELGAKVRNAFPSYSGSYPKILIFQGKSDTIVDKANMTELVDQWTNVWATDLTADLTKSPYEGNANVTYREYQIGGTPVVATFEITGMAHAVPIDPGAVDGQGGSLSAYTSTVTGLYSSYQILKFFGIIP